MGMIVENAGRGVLQIIRIERESFVLNFILIFTAFSYHIHMHALTKSVKVIVERLQCNYQKYVKKSVV